MWSSCGTAIERRSNARGKLGSGMRPNKKGYPMRVYIKDIKPGDEKNETKDYTFTKSAEGAWYWGTNESAELAKSMIFSGGIIVKTLDGGSYYCTEFHVEPRSQGGFAISCELPSLSAPSGYVGDGRADQDST